MANFGGAGGSSPSLDPRFAGGSSQVPPESPVGPWLIHWLTALEEAIATPLEPNLAPAIKNVVKRRLGSLRAEPGFFLPLSPFVGALHDAFDQVTTVEQVEVLRGWIGKSLGQAPAPDAAGFDAAVRIQIMSSLVRDLEQVGIHILPTVLPKEPSLCKALRASFDHFFPEFVGKQDEIGLLSAVLTAADAADVFILPKTRETEAISSRVLCDAVFGRLGALREEDVEDDDALDLDLDPNLYRTVSAVGDDGDVTVDQAMFAEDPGLYMELASPSRRVFVRNEAGQVTAAFGGSLATLPNDDLVNAIDRRLDSMLAHPGGMWGSTESYELQVILLLELKFCPDQEGNELMMRFNQFVKPRHPDIGCRPLCAVTESYLTLARELTAFRKYLAQDPS